MSSPKSHGSGLIFEVKKITNGNKIVLWNLRI